MAVRAIANLRRLDDSQRELSTCREGVTKMSELIGLLSGVKRSRRSRDLRRMSK